VWTSSTWSSDGNEALFMGDLKLVGICEQDMENKIKIVTTTILAMTLI
jgi:hypothetical protein